MIAKHHETIRRGASGACLLALLLLAAAPGTALAQARVRGADLTIGQIDAAVARGIQAIYQTEPTYTFPPEHLYHTGHYNQAVRNMMGNHALASWSLLAAGESYQNPPLYKRINWVLSSDAVATFDRGMRATMLAHLPPARWAPWIRRDALWLQSAMTTNGNFADTWTGTKLNGNGDNANGQYAVLGLWHLDRSGYTIKDETWRAIDAYWRSAQIPTEGDLPAGWGVFSAADAEKNKNQLEFFKRASGPMTGGAVASLCLTERYIFGPSMTDPNQPNVSPHLRKGIRWLDENFSLDDKGEEADWFYYMWCIQRVGGATGYRTFNGVDWFRDVTARILNQQAADGTFQGTQGRLLSTSFALLYLSKANDPLSISKIRFKIQEKDGRFVDGAWNNRPHDIWNFVEYASEQYELSTTWQIAELTQPAYELIESPILYLATDKPFTLSDIEINNLRAYIEAGGMLVTNPEDARGDALKSVRDLAAKLFPDFPFEPIPNTHGFFDVHQRLQPGLQMSGVQNGIRPLLVHFNRDIGRDLQRNDRGRSPGFPALSNLYLYSTGKNPRRARLENNFVVQRIVEPNQKLSVARIKHSGRYDPEPAALRQLKAIVANEQNIDLQISEVEPAQLKDQKVAFLTTMGDASLTDAEAAAIRRWVEGGGTLWLDAAGGLKQAADSAEALVTKILPNAHPGPMHHTNRIISGVKLPGGIDNRRVQYRWYALQTMGPVYLPRLQVTELGGRSAVIYSPEDLTCGLAGLDHWGIFGYTPEFARRLVINGLLDAMHPLPPQTTPVADRAGN